MKKIIRMREMADNQAGTIKKVSATGEMGRRLREMGLVPDTLIQIQGRAPLKEPWPVGSDACWKESPRRTVLTTRST